MTLVLTSKTQATGFGWQRVFPMFAVICYLLCAGIVPQGHMAAPLSSGTAFHLCPADARSALVSDALASFAKGNTHHHHGHHDGGDPPGAASETSADPGCLFAGVGNALAQIVSLTAISDEGLPARAIAFRTTVHRQSFWLRPPARSPPV